MVQDFGHETLPYGVFSTPDNPATRIGVAIGTSILDLGAVADRLPDDLRRLATAASLTPLLHQDRATWDSLHTAVDDISADPGALISQPDATMHLPFAVADYVDFYSSRQHAENVGRMFRPDDPPLLPNWLHMPIAYHGRAGTVVVSGTPIRRPKGQRRGDPGPTFGPSGRLDIELELGFVLGNPTALGEPVPTQEAADHIFGVVLVNDWSARDIQAWEYRPLGPFLGKSFATSVSAWVVPYPKLPRSIGSTQEPAPLPYLQGGDRPLDLDLEIWLRPAGSDDLVRIGAVNSAEGLYWTPSQQVAHLTVNGATVRAGDLIASGTISGDERASFGSLLEMSWNGTSSIEIGDLARTFLEDGDEVVLRGTAGGIVLGEVSGQIVG